MPRQPPPESLPPAERLVAVLRRLLEPDGCPWDRAQTHTSLKPYLLEECHELLEAIDRNDPAEIREELGDVLLQVVFHAELARAAGRFDFDEVARGIAGKIVHRHPHVFGTAEAAHTPGEVERRWDEVKRREKARTSLLDGIPPSLPGLRRAAKLGERAARVGFDWPDADGVRTQLLAELDELDQARRTDDPEAVRHEIGDLLLTAAHLARRLGHDPEEALREANARFQTRFQAMEALAAAEQRPLGPPDGPHGRTLEQLNELWETAKRR